jgi:hypothetical protein
VTVKNATELVVAVENTLGWVPDHMKYGSVWKARSIEAGKINKKLKATPGVTLGDLELAMEYCRRKREHIASPVALFWRVDDAKAMANEVVELSDLSTDIQAALDWEMGHDLEEKELWVGRLARAHGPARSDVLTDWRKARGRG